ncbi:MBL fold metallo-hydrolase [Actinomadura decatromicini]|uniref:MBL fold metallo-hydrolase n=2 Tax=Actinomadura decatromicini TaxID=2604572 RepID=A0A5D3FSG6_9ACTN|nr:MBL fold metallo-hydrolase [Actinomadura decatromicini]
MEREMAVPPAASPATYAVGRTRISHLSDGVATGPRRFWFTGAEPSEWMPVVGVDDPDTPFPVTFGGFVVTGDGHVTLVDAGWGHRAHEIPGLAGAGRFLDGLAALGISPADVDQIVQTHLHADHCGWLIRDDEGSLTFPNATVHVHEREAAYWTGDDVKAIPFNNGMADKVRARLRAVENAGRLHLFDGDLALSEEMRIVRTHGHTPGHVSVVVADGPDTAILAGDLAHHPAHVEHHCWLPSVDEEPSESVRSREKIAALAADTAAIVLAPHFPIPTAVQVGRDPGGKIKTVARDDLQEKE